MCQRRVECCPAGAGAEELRLKSLRTRCGAVKSRGVVCDGYRVIFMSGQALSAGMVGAVTSSVAGWSAALVTERTRQWARTSRPR
jgi:hypothetical protein